MILSSRPTYLVLHLNSGGTSRRVSVSETLADAVKEWTAGSRISPIWPVKRAGQEVKVFDAFAGDQHLLFLGPVRPALLSGRLNSSACAGDVSAWLTHGCFNVVIAVTRDAETAAFVTDLLQWARQEEIPHELWELTNGVVQSHTHFTLPERDDTAILLEIAELVQRHDAPPVHTTLQENRS